MGRQEILIKCIKINRNVYALLSRVTELQASIDEENEIDYAVAAYKESLKGIGQNS